MIKRIIKAIITVLFRIKINGNLSKPDAKKLLIIANHQSFLDGFLLGLFLPFRATFVIHTTVLDNLFFRAILSLTPYITVDPTNPMAMKKIIKLLDAGEPVVIFPEGRITLTGNLMKVYEGPAFAAAKTGATILPIHLKGPLQSYFSRVGGLYKQHLFPQITLTALPTTIISQSTEKNAKKRRHHAGEMMRKLMQNMIFESRTPQTLFAACVESMQLHGRKTKLLEDMKQQQQDYGQIITQSLALGRLVEKIAQPKEAIGILMPNVISTVSLIFGTSAMNRIPAMLNYTSGSSGIKNACIAANVKTIISSRQFIKTANLDNLINDLDDFSIIYLEDLRKQFSLKDKLWLLGYARWFPSSASKSHNANDTAVILFTSGSEGKPKGVVHSHHSILSNVAQVCSLVDFSPADKFMVALPLFHAFGFTCGAIMPIVRGYKAFLYPSPLHYRVIPEIIYDRSCTVLFGTSTFLGNYARFANTYDFHTLRYVIAGAEKLNSDVSKLWIDKFGLRIFEGYGATECGPVLAVNTPMSYQKQTVGTFLPGIEAKLEPISGIEDGGLLKVRGPNIMQGYYLYDQPGVLTPPADGWYDTGDIVAIDQHGFISIKGRVKRFAKIAGEMVSLETVEQLAYQCSPQHQHAASTQTDNKRGENIVLFTTDLGLKRESLQRMVQTLGIAELAIPRKLIMVKQMPLLGTGKTDYVSLKNMAATA